MAVSITLVKNEHGDFETHRTGCSDIDRAARRYAQSGERPVKYTGDTLATAIDAMNADMARWFAEEPYTESSRENGCWTFQGTHPAPCLAKIGIGQVTFDEDGRPSMKEKVVAAKKVVRIRPTTQTPARGFVKKTRITKVDSGENIEVQRNKRAALVTEKQASKASRVREALKAGATLVEIANDADLGVTYAYAWDVMSAMVKAGNLNPKAARAAR